MIGITLHHPISSGIANNIPQPWGWFTVGFTTLHVYLYIYIYISTLDPVLLDLSCVIAPIFHILYHVI